MMATMPNRMMATYGVSRVGCTRPSTRGSCRCCPSENASLETPMMPAFVAMKRMVAARMPTHGPRIQRSHATLSGRNRTIPSTGSAM